MIYNYFVCTTERGDGKRLYSTVYRAPVGHCSMSDATEHYKGAGKWERASRRDPAHPKSGHRLANPGARRFPADGKLARAFMLGCARRERAAALLARAERFIAGFEDDASQKGVTRLLRDLRRAQMRGIAAEAKGSNHGP